MKYRTNRRRVRHRLGVLMLIVVSILVMRPGTASSDTPTAVGWWTTENPNLPISPTEVVPVITLPSGGGPVGLPSDIPPGGLEVANAPGVISYAAIGYYGYGSTVSDVVLDLAPDAADLPGSKVEACPLSGSGTFASQYGATKSLGPAYNCAKSVPGVENSTARTVTFAAGRFMINGYLGIAIVGTGTTRMVFSPPNQSTIHTSAPPNTTLPASPIQATASPYTTVPTTTATVSIPATVTGPAVAAPVPQITSPAPQSVPAPRLASPAPSLPSIPHTSLVAVNLPSDTIGAGSTVVGALIVLSGFFYIMRRNREAMRPASPEAGSQ